MRASHKFLSALLLTMLICLSGGASLAQRNGAIDMGPGAAKLIVYGDFNVVGAPKDKPLLFTVLLTRTGGVFDRQTVGGNGRYQFNNVDLGDYDLVVELENKQIYRDHIKLTGMDPRFRRDINLALDFSSGMPVGNTKPATVSPKDVYERKGANKDRFEKAEEAYDKKEYDKAITFFTQVVTDDAKDFQAWSELGTVYLVQKNLVDAEKAYLRATEVRPTFFLALLNLGRVRLGQKNFDGAITTLDQAVSVQPSSAEANYQLGNAYLQIKKGSKAVGYLNEALKLDPVAKADAHLLLAALYNGAGMKDKAAVEYEAFLKKKPDYADRKKLEAYIAANKAKTS